MQIRFDSEESWLRACAAMVREGIMFVATEGNGTLNQWYIEPTGGY